MTRIVTVDGPQSAVAAYLSDPTRSPEWDLGTASCRRLDNGPLRSGAMVEKVWSVAGREVATVHTVVGFEAGRCIALQGGNDEVRLLEEMWFASPTGQSTAVTNTVHARLTGMARLASPLLPVVLGRLVDARARRMSRALIEDSPAAELVVLLDEQGNAVGTAPKATVHTASTPLHRGFSCYLFDDDGQLLLTRRAAHKRTFPGLWTNSVCGHPGPGESDVQAVRRRARHELGLDIDVNAVRVAVADFRYRAEHDGVVENEVCPVYVGRASAIPEPNPDEVDDIAWVSWPEFLTSVERTPDEFSPWCREQAARMRQGGAGIGLHPAVTW